MGEGLNLTFLQRRRTDDQEAQGKVISVANY